MSSGAVDMVTERNITESDSSVALEQSGCNSDNVSNERNREEIKEKCIQWIKEVPFLS